MLQDFLRWLPDVAVGTLEIRDILNIAVGLLGVYLAYLATRIAKKQDDLLEEQRAKTAKVGFGLWPTAMRENGHVDYLVYIRNIGTAKANGLRWRLMIPHGQPARPVFMSDVPYDQSDKLIEHTECAYYEGFITRPVFKNEMRDIARMTVTTGKDPDVPHDMRWQITSDDGEWPGEGAFGHLDLHKPEIGMAEYLHYFSRGENPGYTYRRKAVK